MHTRRIFVFMYHSFKRATSLKNTVPSCCVIILEKICIRLRPIPSKIGRALYEWMVDLGVDNKSLFPLFAIIGAFITPPMRYTNLKQYIFICACMQLFCVIVRGILFTVVTLETSKILFWMNMSLFTTAYTTYSTLFISCGGLSVWYTHLAHYKKDCKYA